MNKQQIAEELILLQKKELKQQGKMLQRFEKYFKKGFFRSMQSKKAIQEYSTKIEILEKELATKNEEIAVLKQAHLDEIMHCERVLEGTIDQQDDEIRKLKTQLEHAKNNKVGKFYVFNPQHGQPRKIYDTYEAAMRDAESVAKISKGQKVFVLKIISGVQIQETIEDYSLIPEEEIPF